MVYVSTVVFLLFSMITACLYARRLNGRNDCLDFILCMIAIISWAGLVVTVIIGCFTAKG